jgi:hypothetical protein
VIPEAHLRAVGILDDVKVGNDVARIVPDEAGTRAGRHVEDAAAAEVEALPKRGDEDDGRAIGVEEFDRRFLVGGEIAARGDGARFTGDFAAIDIEAIEREAREDAEDQQQDGERAAQRGL